MVCLGLPKHFLLILLSFAVCPFKSVWSQSHMLSLFSGAYLDTVTRNPFQVIQLVESSKHLPVKRVSGTQNSLGTWQGSRTGIPVPVYSFDSIVLLSEETQQPLHVCSQLCLVQFGFVPPSNSSVLLDFKSCEEKPNGRWKSVPGLSCLGCSYFSGQCVCAEVVGPIILPSLPWDTDIALVPESLTCCDLLLWYL